MIRNCHAHDLSLWMIIQKNYAGLNFVYRNLLDTVSGGTFMEITLGEATKLLDKNDNLNEVVSELSMYYVHIKKASEKTQELNEYLTNPDEALEEKIKKSNKKSEEEKKFF